MSVLEKKTCGLGEMMKVNGLDASLAQKSDFLVQGLKEMIFVPALVSCFEKRNRDWRSERFEVIGDICAADFLQHALHPDKEFFDGAGFKRAPVLEVVDDAVLDFIEEGEF